MNKLIDYINQHTIDEMLDVINKNKTNKQNAIQQLKDARKEIGLKIQEIIEKLERQ